ncbi:MAG: ASCH domain-containing protein [Chloroflexota bacterium]|jgi:uncharacterized protein YhfF|nr:ASCH domain-containing protein [Chloroflexota bacterium]
MAAADADDVVANLPKAQFAFPGPLRERLIALVLAGTKTATAGLVADYIADGDVIPRPGDREVVIDSGGRSVAIIETTRCEITTISKVTDAFARDEGEGYADATDWRRSHERFWGSYIDDIRNALGDPAFQLQDSTPVVCQWIRVVRRLDQGRSPTGGSEPDATG